MLGGEGVCGHQLLQRTNIAAGPYEHGLGFRHQSQGRGLTQTCGGLFLGVIGAHVVEECGDRGDHGGDRQHRDDDPRAFAHCDRMVLGLLRGRGFGGDALLIGLHFGFPVLFFRGEAVLPAGAGGGRVVAGGCRAGLGVGRGRSRAVGRPRSASPGPSHPRVVLATVRSPPSPKVVEKPAQCSAAAAAHRRLRRCRPAADP